MVRRRCSLSSFILSCLASRIVGKKMKEARGKREGGARAGEREGAVDGSSNNRVANGSLFPLHGTARMKEGGGEKDRE